MNKFAIGLAALSIAFAGAAVAQEKPTAAKPAAVAIPSGVFYKGQQANQHLARDFLIGAKVKNAQGQIIGDIEDLILNDQNQVEGVIMGTGGFLGAAEKKVGVRLSALKFTEAGVSLPEATKDVLKALEPYKRAKPPKSLLDRAMDKAKELADKTAETSKDAYQSAKEQAGPALQKAKEAAGQAYEKGKEAVGQAVEKAKESAKPAEAPKQ